MNPEGQIRTGAPRPGAAIALFLLATALLFDHALFRGESFFSRDVAPFFYPMKHFLAATVRSGQWPLWNPYVAGGEPFFASLQPGLLYPPSLILYLAPLPAAFDLLVVLHYPIAGIGMFLLLKRWGHDWVGALTGGMVFMLGGFFVSLGNFVNNLQTVAWVPWVFLAWDRLLTRGRYRDVAVFASVCGVAFLGGEPQMLGMALAIMALHGLLSVERRSMPRGRQLVALTLGGALAMGLVAIQLLPFAEYMGLSVRRLPIELEYAASRSLEPAGLLHFLVPPALRTGAHGFSTRFVSGSSVPWLLSVYLGAVALSIAAVGALRPRARRWLLFWGGTAFLGVLLAFGTGSPLYRTLFDFVPAFRPFRYPEKFLQLTALAFAMFAARGADVWLSGRPGASGSRAALAVWAPIGTVAAIAAGLAAVLSLYRDGIGSACRGWLGTALLCGDPATAQVLYAETARRLAGLMAVFGGVTWLFRTGRLRVEPAAALLLCLVVVDLALAHREVNPTVESEVYVSPPWTAEVLDGLMKDRGAFRYRGSPHGAAMGSIVTVRGAWELTNMYLDYQTMGPNVGQIFGFPMQDGLQGVELISVALTNEAAMRAWSEDPLRFLRAMNVGFYADATAGADSIGGLSLAASHPELPIRIYEVPAPVPRIYLAPAYELRENEAQALRRTLEPDFALGEAVVLERRPPVEPLRQATGRVLSRSETVNRVRARVEATGNMLMVLNDRYYPGWRAAVDGEEVPILRANGTFRAVAVPPGVSEIEFRFAPVSVLWGAWISFAGLAALTIAALPMGKRRL